jgi:hypothetical protein
LDANRNQSSNIWFDGKVMAVKMIGGLLGSSLEEQKILLMFMIEIILFSYTDWRRGRLFLPGHFVAVVNMLKGERAGGNCINYTNVAY